MEAELKSPTTHYFRVLLGKMQGNLAVERGGREASGPGWSPEPPRDQGLAGPKRLGGQQPGSFSWKTRPVRLSRGMRRGPEPHLTPLRRPIPHHAIDGAAGEGQDGGHLVGPEKTLILQ